jgi:hypothetical protein
MSEPGRLFDESDDELERLLIGTARSERSSAKTRAHTLAALGVTGSAALAVATASASVAPAALGKLTFTWAKLALGLSALGTIAAVPPAYHAWQRHQAAEVERQPSQAVAPAQRPEREQPESATPAPAGDATELAADLATGLATGLATDLGRELQALDAARAALAHRQPQRALARLDAYAAAFPQRRLGLEAEILRIDALARSGRRGEARAHAAAFLHEHPKSVLAARAGRYLRD